ncbi:MAG TPA: DUF5916 domain-containing protein, partial [Gemmatimonadaceae bacterium]|nr:DUF5916 domain-containing protein [Gemmatimonadaceae bacterium]
MSATNDALVPSRMLLPLVLLLVHAVPDSTSMYDGRRRQLDVRPPRLEAASSEITIDGALDEAAWRRAAMLVGFSQYSPTDGRPAEDSTVVLVWYSATAIHFGIRAYEAHGPVRATLADRDRIFADDHVQLFLGTFDDGRQATVLAVNPLGVQADGALVETGRASGGFMGDAQRTREPTDLSPDYVFQSKGRVTPWGYEVEVRVPFKSIRFQPAPEQRWTLNVTRQVQHSGHEDSWAPARRSGASFLAQSGRLSGLRELRRGLVLDVTPTLTARSDGARAMDGGWDYRAGDPEVGGTVRWGITNNLTLNATANPDFSQVEADASEFAFDPRSGVFLQERRPYFLEGIEQFAVPQNLIYTRSIVQPVASAKLTGKVSGIDVAFLSAVDDRPYSFTGRDRPIANILRVQRDLGRQSRLGMAYTDRVEGDRANRVLDVDGRFVFGGVYALQFQAAGSRTRAGDSTVTAPLWDLSVARNGRSLGFRYRVGGIDEQFETWSGFISRGGVGRASASHRHTWFGATGARLETFTTELVLDGTWKYAAFVNGNDALEKKLHLNTSARLRGGWTAGASVLVERFGYDPDIYTGYAIAQARADGTGVDTLPFTGPQTASIPNLDVAVTVATPEFRHFSADAFVLYGHDENFFEWAS